MAPARGRYARRQRRAARRARNRQGWMGTARKALAIATAVQGIVNSELLHYDETNNITPDNSTGSVVGISRGMSQGDTNNTFKGNSILLKKINLRFSCLMNSSATATRMRFLVLRDTRPLTSLPAITDVLSGTNVQSFMNIDNQIQRFRVLMDRRIVLTTNYPEKMFIFNRKFRRMHIKFDDNQVPVLNDIVILAVSDEPTNTPTVNIGSRLRFYDN